MQTAKKSGKTSAGVVTAPASSPKREKVVLYKGTLRRSGKNKLAPVAFKGDPYQIIQDMRKGTPANVIPEMAARLGVSQDNLFVMLRLPRSTMKGRVSKNAALSGAEQDRMYRAERVWTRAVAVLEDEASAQLWINRSNRALGGEAPLSLLDTEVGYELVLDTLARIEYGVVS